MSSRRQPQNENVIHSTRRGGVTHTLSSANKIKSSKENILSSNRKSTLTKDISSGKDLRVAGRSKEDEGEKNAIKSLRKPLDPRSSSTTTSTPRTALSSKSTGVQAPLQTQKTTLKPKTAATPSSKPKSKPRSALPLAQTPSQGRISRVKSTLNIYTPGVSTTSKSKIRIKEDREDEVDEVEYMPPSVQEREYESHFAMPNRQFDEDLEEVRPKRDLGFDLDLHSDVDAPMNGHDNLPSRGNDNGDLSFELDLPEEDDLQIQHLAQNDFMLEI
ncbi:hypothetical protein I302_102774 [Kwoniella bestiolae CBS 10118]|uniref:Uncharacterized protein n=1 Tax=Kwoniella bestiolae CBS 10118 TaxID=1296100 RepID=A0A1B9GFW8_9TREE|nr:hypothetical protein I302_01467 [Kwoniella bestiolae CBS 10118]OCF29953.1 hypothetical protein I302_01467 [Kwoniella bestiolae CBS 10118]